MEKYTRENLSALRLSSLREIGWELGVKSPTSKTKAELIQAILDIKEGRVLPQKSTRGRPRLKMYLIENSSLDINEIEKIIENNINKIIKRVLNNKLNIIKQEILKQLTDNYK